jgi:DNA-binding protein HU-beta
MRKVELIAEISEKTQVDKAQVSKVVESFMETVKERMLNNERVDLRGFGNFSLKMRAAKLARNIDKGTSLQLPARYIPSCKFAIEFANEVNAVKIK